MTGIVATAELDRFLSYGVHLERFKCERWYQLPGVASRELRRLSAGLKPVHVTQELLDRSR